MALTDFKPQFDNAYEELFEKSLVAKKIASLRLEPMLKFGESVERILPDVSGVLVRTVTRGAASTIDSLTDSSELLTVNYEKEAVFHLSDGEVKQAGSLNPGEVLGAQIALKVAADFDANIFAEVQNALYDFDNGDLTTLSSDGTGITWNATNIPLVITLGPAKLRFRNNQTLTNMALVIDSYRAAGMEQYLLGKSIDMAGAVFANGYAGKVTGAEVYISENLTATAVLTASGVFVNTQTVTINGVVFTSETSASSAGSFTIGTAAESLGYLANLINNPGTTVTGQVAFSQANQDLIAAMRISAVATATTLTITAKSGALTVAETQTNCAWSLNTLHCYYGKKGGIDVVMQDMKEVDMRPTADRRGTNVFTHILGGYKTFTDGSKKFLDLRIAI